MAISIDSLKFKASERMTDNSDGGGRMGATEILSGVENSIFDDVSDVDRAAGDCSIRKIYATVASADTDKYLDAGVVIFKAPTDPNVRVLATTTNSFYDERVDIKNHIERYSIPGARYQGTLYGNQVAGSRSITIFGSEILEPPSVNQTMVIIQDSTIQYVRIVRIIYNQIVTFEDGTGEYNRRVITCELSSPLAYTFNGAQVDRTTSNPSAAIYSTVIADVARYYGIRPLVTEATTGNLSVYTDGIYDRIVPTSQTETPNLDITAAAERTFAVAGSESSISFVVGDTFSPNFTLYIGRAILPNSLSIAVSGGTLTDDGGKLMSGAAEIGTVNYTDGAVIFSSVSPTYSGSKTVTFIPAAPLTRASNSFGIPITAETRFRTYVANLNPRPNAGTLVVDYLSQGNWYRLSDDGNGILTGASESYGAGTLNLTTGSVSLTLGAYPDVYSSILFTYGSGATVYPVTGPESLEIILPLTVNRGRTTAGSAKLAWSSFELNDDGTGKLIGSGGSARIADDGIVVTTDTLPPKDTVFTLDYESFNIEQTFLTEEFENQTADNDGMVSLQLTKELPTTLTFTFVVQTTRSY
jgi:hypothetical protein